MELWLIVFAQVGRKVNSVRSGKFNGSSNEPFTCLLLLVQKKKKKPFVEDESLKHSESHTNTPYFFCTILGILIITTYTAVWECLSTASLLKVAHLKIKIKKKILLAFVKSHSNHKQDTAQDCFCLISETYKLFKTSIFLTKHALQVYF